MPCRTANLAFGEYKGGARQFRISNLPAGRQVSNLKSRIDSLLNILSDARNSLLQMGLDRFTGKLQPVGNL